MISIQWWVSNNCKAECVHKMPANIPYRISALRMKEEDTDKTERKKKCRLN